MRQELEAPPTAIDWVSQARAGDPYAYGELARAHEGRLFRQAIVLCRDAALAEDLAAETLIEGWKSLARYDGACRFSTWLYAILLHRFQKYTRRIRSRPFPLAWLPRSQAADRLLALERVVDPRPNPTEELSQDETADSLHAAIESLPERHQEVVRLRFYEDASLLEIAAALQLSVGTVKSRLHHALDKLRRMKIIMNLQTLSGDT